MEIIKHGIDPKKLLYEATCDKCGCCFVFEKREIISEIDRNDLYKFVRCPEPFCNNIIYERQFKLNDNDKE